jgi:hypothetical protein
MSPSEQLVKERSENSGVWRDEKNNRSVQNYIMSLLVTNSRDGSTIHGPDHQGNSESSMLAGEARQPGIRS